MLSSGCTDEHFDTRRLGKLDLSGLWAARIVAVIMRRQSFDSLDTAYTLTGHENEARINLIVSRKRFALDSANGMPDLCAMGMYRAKNESGKVQPAFFTELVEPFNARWKL